ncbi:hypothetical protein D9M71_548890 [compost metagenome]
MAQLVELLGHGVTSLQLVEGHRQAVLRQALQQGVADLVGLVRGGRYLDLVDADVAEVHQPGALVDVGIRGEGRHAVGRRLVLGRTHGDRRAPAHARAVPFLDLRLEDLHMLLARGEVARPLQGFGDRRFRGLRCLQRWRAEDEAEGEGGAVDK